jgi:SAM-dependent methyltransferase
VCVVTLEATDVFAPALSPAAWSSGPEWFARHEDGRRRPLTQPLGRWLGPVDSGDRSMLARVSGAALDLGCGPGRLVVELARRGVHALGVDISADAVHLARRAGAAVLRRSLFSPLPGEGRWDTVLLADGNVGIGGDPGVLLRRCRQILAPGGRAVVELEEPGTGLVCTRLRLERGAEATSWFDWASLGVDAVPATAAQAGLRVQESWEQSGRWFATLLA